jgi:type III restriction enzyme
VPSVAIRIGVKKSIDQTQDHFRSIYGNQNISAMEYSGDKLSNLRKYSHTYFKGNIDVLIITLAAFNKASNNLFKATEKLQGEWLPYQYIQAVRPILILDEPQNMESGKSKEALRTLKPLFGLRYSATHRTNPNLVYRLTPVEAFRQGLVKRIQVIGVSEEENENLPIMRVIEAKRMSAGIRAILRLKVLKNGIFQSENLTIKQNDDLFKKTKNEDYKGFIVENINIKANIIEFRTGERVELTKDSIASGVALFRFQIRETIKAHIDNQQRLKKEGIKVLSLFFIDRVANYLGTANDEPIIRQIFDEEFNKLKSTHADFKDLSPSEVQAAYFASYRKKPRGGKEQTIYVDTEGTNKAEKKAQKEQFELIMRDKENLLSFSENRCFIFAHSALKEGWDNPNVFQICTLKQTGSVMRKRQEIGRGLRLAVRQNGERVHDENINILTVIANESYEDFANGLQNEYKEAGEIAPPAPTKKGKPANRRNHIYESEDFIEFWEKIARKTNYKINIDTKSLVKACVDRLNKVTFPTAKIAVTKGNFNLTKYRFLIESLNDGEAKVRLKVNYSDKRKDENLVVKLKRNDDLQKTYKHLRGFKVTAVEDLATEKRITFKNKRTISSIEEHTITINEGLSKDTNASMSAAETYPVHNFLNRTAKETRLTKQTLVQIFGKISQDKRVKVFSNPEGFIATFIAEIRNAVADHLTENLEFEVANDWLDNKEQVFPEHLPMVQREVIPGKEKSLYDMIKYDSEIEKDFILHKLHDDENIIFYFKFPDKFKITLPNIIGNYNPDWGIVRKSDDGKLKLQLVRETKGSADIETLRFAHEKRKVKLAHKHFATLGVDYKAIKGDELNWYLEDSGAV